MAKIIDGKQIAQNVKEELKIKVKEFFDKCKNAGISCKRESSGIPFV